jgi:hypothetical protein
MPEDARGRVLRLIALATAPSANETEARNAAVAACKIIKEHGLLDRAAPSTPPARRGFAASDMQDAIDELFGMHQRARQERVRAARPPPQHTVEGDWPKPKIKKDPNARMYVLATPAICTGCMRLISHGTVMVSNRLIWHPKCYEDAAT